MTAEAAPEPLMPQSNLDAKALPASEEPPTTEGSVTHIDFGGDAEPVSGDLVPVAAGSVAVAAVKEAGGTSPSPNNATYEVMAHYAGRAKQITPPPDWWKGLSVKR